MTNLEQQIATSVVVIGTGGSGLRAAIELAERGIDVLVVGKRPKTDAHTTLAAGGINAALATMDADDTWQQHAADTLTELPARRPRDSAGGHRGCGGIDQGTGALRHGLRP